MITKLLLTAVLSTCAIALADLPDANNVFTPEQYADQLRDTEAAKQFVQLILPKATVLSASKFERRTIANRDYFIGTVLIKGAKEYEGLEDQCLVGIVLDVTNIADRATYGWTYALWIPQFKSFLKTGDRNFLVKPNS